MASRLLTAFALVMLASVAEAQGSATAIWVQPNADVATAQAYITTLTVDAAAPIPLTPTCSIVNGATTCQAPVANWDATVVHNVVLTVANSNGSASSTLTTGVPPSKPTGFSITVTTTTTTTTTVVK